MHRTGRKIQTAFVLIACLFLFHCTSYLPSKSYSYFESCQEDAAIELIKTLDVKEKDILLFDLALLSLGIHGNYDDMALRHGTRALSNMWTHGDKGRGRASMVSSEAARDYKGEPFEKTMAGIYLGSLFFNQGDYENARAAFQKAVLASQTKSNKTKNEKVPLAHFLLARTFQVLGQEDNARISLEKAWKYSTVLEKVQVDSLSKIHTIVIVETGSAPKKHRSGPGRSLIEYEHNYSKFLGANLFVNDQFTSETRVVEDLFVHAKENERSKKAALQATKGVARDVATVVAVDAAVNDKAEVALIAGLFALANQSQADIRQWEFLPARLHIAWDMSVLKEGDNTYSLQFLTNSKRINPLVQQQWTDERSQNVPKIYIKKARTCGTSGQ